MILSSKGLPSDPDKLSVIQDFPIPILKSSLRLRLGLCQQLLMWYPELALCQSGLCHLTRDNVEFVWTDQMTEKINSTKQLLQWDAHVQPCDMMLVPTLYADGSILNGAGYILVQQMTSIFQMTTSTKKSNHDRN